MLQSVDYAVYIILEQSMCNVFVDGELVGYCHLPIAFTLYAVCFYALNLRYPAHSAKSLLFIQKFVFKINDVNCDQHVTSTMSQFIRRHLHNPSRTAGAGQRVKNYEVKQKTLQLFNKKLAFEYREI
jgi:hypothetical protein